MFRDLPPYGETRFSDFWTSKVPSSWSEMPGLAVLEVNRRTNKGLVEDQVLSLSYGKVIVRPVEKQRGLVPESYEGYQILDPGDIVVRPTDLQNDQTSIRVGHVRDRGIITSAYIGLRPRGEWSDAYAYLYLSVIDSSKRIYGMGSGLRQQLGWDDLKRMPCLVPPVEEQAAIVKYLAHANARIDKAIAAKHRLIALLEEQKSLLAEHAIFGEPCDGIQRRDSAVPWLGEVPVEWDLAAVRYTFRAVTRTPIGNEEKFSVTQKQGLVRTDAMEENSTQAGSFENFQACHPGDLVLNKYKAHLGVFWGAKEPGLITPNYSVFKPVRPVNNDFIEILFRTSRYIQVFRHSVYGVTEGMSPLYTKDFYRIPLLLPPASIQSKIVEQVRTESAVLMSGTSKFVREIDLLEEYRSRLIAEVVTGQVDVRAISASLPDAPSGVAMQDIHEAVADGDFGADEFGEVG